MTDQALMNEIEDQKCLMILAATHQPDLKRDDARGEYERHRSSISVGLAERGLEEPNPFFGPGSLVCQVEGREPTHQSRREYIRNLYAPTLEITQSEPGGSTSEEGDRDKSGAPEVPDCDLFLSHAFEDKETIARPLYEQLANRGISVWYD
ncbi:MAG TPA: hypothetical protein VJX67_19910 [Blastocatellia bacterium]|nr:hypothetical protein [Blastocatellia bacterium]